MIAPLSISHFKHEPSFEASWQPVVESPAPFRYVPSETVEGCTVIFIGPPRRRVREARRVVAARSLHAYGAHGASALCGEGNWRELVPPDEATCPACQARLGRSRRGGCIE